MTASWRRAVAAVVAAAGLTACAGTPPPAPTGPPPGLLPDGARPELVVGGFGLAEGPIWDGGRLLVSDVTGDAVDAVDGTARIVVRRPSGYANGHARDAQGRLVEAQHGNRRVVRYEGDRETVLADRYQGRRLNSPNDVAVAPDGAVLFTDPTFGLTPPYGPPGQRAELDLAGVYRIPPGGGEPQLLTRDLAQPNGIDVSPDGATLYVSDSGSGTVTAHPLGATLGPGRVLGPGVDGLAVDRDGRVWASVPSGVAVYDPAGAPVTTIPLPDQPTNLAWGGPDGTALFVTTYTGVYRLPTRTTGRAP